MGAIFKREFRAHLTNIFGWIFIAVSIGVIGFSVVLTNLSGGMPQIEYGLNVSVMVMILTIPFLSMFIFAPENKNGNTKFLLSLPVNTHNIVLGKFFAALAIFAIPTLVLAIMPLLLSVYGTILFSQSYASILAYLLIGVDIISLCMFIGAHSRNSVVTLIAGTLVSAVLYAGPALSVFIPTTPIASFIAIAILEIIISLIVWLLSKKLAIGGVALGVSVIPTAIVYLISPNSFTSLFRRILLFISPFERMSNFCLGIFDLKDVIYLLSLAALFIFLTCKEIEKARDTLNRTTPKSLAYVVLSLVLTVAINLGVFAIPSPFISFDTSGLGIYTLSDASKEFAAGIDENVTIYLLSEQGIPDAQIEQILLEYEARNTHIDYKLVNVTSNPDFVSKYIGVSYYDINKDGIMPLNNHSIIIESSKRYTVIDSSNYYRYKVGAYDYSEGEFLALCQQAEAEGYDISIIGYDTFFNLDRIVVSGLEYVILDNVSTVLTLTGHGEQAIDESFYLNIKHTQNGAFDNVLLDSLDSVPDYCSALIISSPKTDISSSDADKIIEYLERGGNVILITSPENTQMPNLLRVAETLGLTAQSGIITDSDKEHHMNDNDAYLVLDANPDHSVSYFVRTNYSTSTEDVIPCFPGAHPIVKTETAGEDLAIKELFMTSEIATVSDSGKPQKYITAYSAEKVIDKETENKANLIWFSSYEAFSKEYAEAHPINMIYLLVSLSYIGGAPDFETSLDVESRNISGSFLKVPKNIPVVWAITFALIILIILCSGIALYVNRRNRRKF